MTTQIQLGAIESNAVTSLQGPRISSIVITDNTYTAIDDTAIDSVAGGYIKIIGSGFASGCIVTIGSVTASSTTFVSSTEVRAQIGAQAAGSYNVYLSNSDGSLAIKVIGINFSGMPSWSTSSTQTFVSQAVSFQFSATSDSSIVYSVNSGSTLPPGLSLSSSGLLSGTATGNNNTVYTFTLQATDAENQNTPRTFNVTLSFSDPYYYLTTMHLYSDGTNNAMNNTFIDSSSTALTVTPTGTPTQGTFSPFSQAGWSNYFNGSTDYISLTEPSATSGALTIEFWIYPVTQVYTGDAFVVGNSGNASGAWAFSFQSSNRTIGVWLDSYGSIALTSNSTLSYNSWNHVALVKTGGVIYLYINGVRQTSTYSQAGSFGRSTTINIGRYTGGGQAYTGYVSNLRMVYGTAVYSGSSFTPPTSQLTAIANTVLLTCLNNRFIDNSTNAYALTINGTPSIQPFSPFAPSGTYSTSTNGGSLYFAGSSDYLTTGSSSVFNITGVNNYTVEFWVYFPSMPNALRGIVTSYNSGSGGSFFVGVTTGNVLNVRTGNDASVANGTTALLPNTWYHVAVVRDGSTSMKAFLNGVLEISSASFNWTGSTQACYIGVYSGGTAINAYVSNIRIQSGTAQYTSAFSPPSIPTTATANTVLLIDGTNAAIYDQTGKNDMVMSGVTKISTAQAKFGNSSISMSGSYLYAAPATASKAFQFYTGDFTIETWVYVPAAGGYQTIATNRPGPATSGSFWFGFNTGTTQLIWIIGGSVVATSNVSISTSTWTHVAATKQSGSLKLWVNGNLANTYSDSSGSYTDAGAGVGVSHNEANYGLVGYLDEFRVTKGYARYTTAFTPSTLLFPRQ